MPYYKIFIELNKILKILYINLFAMFFIIFIVQISLLIFFSVKQKCCKTCRSYPKLLSLLVELFPQSVEHRSAIFEFHQLEKMIKQPVFSFGPKSLWTLAQNFLIFFFLKESRSFIFNIHSHDPVYSYYQLLVLNVECLCRVEI